MWCKGSRVQVSVLPARIALGQAKVLESPLWLGADRAAQASALPPRRRAACSELAEFPMTRICSLWRKMAIVPSNPRSPL